MKKTVLLAVLGLASLAGFAPAQVFEYSIPANDATKMMSTTGTLDGKTITFSGSAPTFVRGRPGAIPLPAPPTIPIDQWVPAPTGSTLGFYDVEVADMESSLGGADITFSAPIVNPVIFLGGLNAGTTLTFSDPFTVTASDFFVQDTATSIRSTDSDESSATLQFTGSFTKMGVSSDSSAPDGMMFQFGVETVPEPSAAFLIGLGGVGLVLRRRKR